MSHPSFPFLAASVLVSFAGASASAVDVADLPWDSSPTAILRLMATDPTEVSVKDNAQHLSFRGGTLSGKSVQAWRWTLRTPSQPSQLAILFTPSKARTAGSDVSADTIYPDLLQTLNQRYGSPNEFGDDTRRDALWTIGPSAVFPGLTQMALLSVVESGQGRHVELSFFELPSAPAGTATASGNAHSQLRYTLQRDPHPTPDQINVYQRMTAAMDQAVRFYDQYTVCIVKTDRVFLDLSEVTAEGNINGDIKFGPTDISLRTALHEMSHTVGIGTTPEYHRLTVNGRFIGKHALAQLRAITGDDHAILHADTWHFWPYGLNNAGEDHSIWDYIHHCQMVSAILQDCRELR